MILFAFYGRVSTEDQQDPESSRMAAPRARQLIEPAGGQIVAEFFDIGQSRSLPWKRRPEASRLLDASATRTAGSTPWSSASRNGRSTATSSA